MADFKMDVTKQGQNKVVWIHKDEQEQHVQQKQMMFNYQQEEIQKILKRPYVQPIVQVNIGDVIEFAINLYNIQGLVDATQIKWCQPKISGDGKNKQNVLNYKNNYDMSKDRAQKIYCDLGRICEIEDAIVEWYDYKYFQRQNEMLSLDFLKPLFDIKKFECAGVDGIICKIQLLAKREGRIYNEFIGIPLVVKDILNQNDSSDESNCYVVNEIKRSGLLVDRYVDLELKIGDTLVIYVQRASA